MCLENITTVELFSYMPLSRFEKWQKYQWQTSQNWGKIKPKLSACLSVTVTDELIKCHSKCTTLTTLTAACRSVDCVNTPDNIKQKLLSLFVYKCQQKQDSYTSRKIHNLCLSCTSIFTLQYQRIFLLLSK